MIGVSLLMALLSAFQPSSCTTAEQCRQLAREAIAAKQFEQAHDLAWLAYQRGPRQDPQTLTLLARVQSLSGRGDDAYVMLRRLAESGIAVPDVGTSEDFSRVRAHPQWTQLLALFESNEASKAVASVEPVPSATPPAPAPTPSRGASAVPAVSSPPASPAPIPASPAERAPLTRVEARRAGEDLELRDVPSPAALAYDAVSARFIVSTSSTDALIVLSQTSTNAAAFTSRGWSGHERTTALTIDRAAGDLWVAVQSASGAAVHRLQLISGRRLDVLELPGDARGDIVGLAMTREGLFALDRAGKRLLRREAQGAPLAPFVALPADTAPTSLTHSPRALYVAHADGILRIDYSSRKPQVLVAPNDHSLAGLQSIAWHASGLVGVQSHGDELMVVRLTLSPAGTRVTRIESLGPATSAAAVLGGDTFYYLTASPDGARVLRAIEVNGK